MTTEPPLDLIMTSEISYRSIALLQNLKTANWLEHCGRQPNDVDLKSYRFVDKAEARKLILSKHWDDTLIDARNGCSSLLPQSELKRWNDIAKIVREKIHAIGCANIASELIAEHFDLKVREVEQTVIDYIHFACVELEYEGFLKPGFFAELCHICLLGRLPCGLEGDFPEGRLIVY